MLECEGLLLLNDSFIENAELVHVSKEHSIAWMSGRKHGFKPLYN